MGRYYYYCAYSFGFSSIFPQLDNLVGLVYSSSVQSIPMMTEVKHHLLKKEMKERTENYGRFFLKNCNVLIPTVYVCTVTYTITVVTCSC